MGKISEKQKESVKKYNAANYDKITLELKKVRLII